MRFGQGMRGWDALGHVGDTTRVGGAERRVKFSFIGVDNGRGVGSGEGTRVWSLAGYRTCATSDASSPALLYGMSTRRGAGQKWDVQGSCRERKGVLWAKPKKLKAKKFLADASMLAVSPPTPPHFTDRCETSRGRI